MKITKKDDKIIVEIDFWQPVNNCYDEDSKRKTHNLIGVIAGDECNISQLIDLDYKGDQQEGEAIVKTDLSKEDFIKLCGELGIDYIEHAICKTCYKAIYGSYTLDKNGKDQCMECHYKEERDPDIEYARSIANKLK